MAKELIYLLWKPIEGNSTFVFVALVLVLLDVVVGFANAVAHREVCSSKMRSGLWHKLGTMFLMLVADVTDGALLGGVDLGFKSPVLVVVCLYIALMELVSVLENICKLNPELANNPLVSHLKGTGKKDDAQEQQ